MKFTKALIKGKFVKRYKRFFADVKVNKSVITAHCPNTGSMMGLLDENNDAWVSKNDDPKRKLKFTLEILKSKNNLIGVNTHLANKLVLEGLQNNSFIEFKNLKKIQSEVFYNKETRFDFLVKKKNKKYFIEVKNVTLIRNSKISEFPDAVTTRGSKHIKTLVEASKKGYQCYVLFLVQISNCKYFKIAKDIDKEYYENYKIAKKEGVNFIAYDCKIGSKEIKVDKKVKIIDE
ncbi:MAG: DNA/RNA nuclease SfsA [Candidatus Pelagibacter sp.]|nr:DNA/RNA nuclease SfsA [Candidatus Pelagibacter sp.]|tara:strand:+ start:6400 stop:7098 length:699 start_codon:yes stop_codon:yes gene_type:complete